MKIAANAEPFWLEQRNDLLADRDRAFLVKCAVIAKAVEIKLQRL
jgi:hypothetical protein